MTPFHKLILNSLTVIPTLAIVVHTDKQHNDHGGLDTFRSASLWLDDLGGVGRPGIGL